MASYPNSAPGPLPLERYCRDIFAEVAPFVPLGWTPEDVVASQNLLREKMPAGVRPLFSTFVDYLQNVASASGRQATPDALDYRGKLLPGVLTQFMGDKLPLALLKDEMARQSAEKKASVALLDLGWNNLMAEDLPAVAEALAALFETAPGSVRDSSPQPATTHTIAGLG